MEQEIQITDEVMKNFKKARVFMLNSELSKKFFPSSAAVGAGAIKSCLRTLDLSPRDVNADGVLASYKDAEETS